MSLAGLGPEQNVNIVSKSGPRACRLFFLQPKQRLKLVHPKLDPSHLLFGVCVCVLSESIFHPVALLVNGPSLCCLTSALGQRARVISLSQPKMSGKARNSPRGTVGHAPSPVSNQSDVVSDGVLPLRTNRVYLSLLSACCCSSSVVCGPVWCLFACLITSVCWVGKKPKLCFIIIQLSR